MNLTEIIAAGRRRNDDEVVPYHFDHSIYTQWVNNAVDEACLRSRAFRDDNTSSVCDVATVASTATITLDPSIVVVRRAVITDGTRQAPLELMPFNEMDHSEPRWDSTQEGEPAAAVTDMTSRTLRLYPVPDAVYNINLLVWRLPLAGEKLSGNSDVPDLLPVWTHKDLAVWLAYEFFSQRDVDVYDPGQADIELADFTARFGTRPNAFELAKWARGRRRTAYAHFM